MRSYSSAGQMPVKLLQCKDAIINGKIVPYHIQVIPTNRCNGNCPWCSCKDVDRSLELDISELSDILHHFKRLGSRAITITGGGEPSIHPQFDNLLAICARLDYNIGLVSNGIKLLDSTLLKTLTWLRVSVIDTIGDYDTSIITNICSHVTADIGISFTVSNPVNIATAKAVCEATKELSNVTHIRFVQDILAPDDTTMDEVKENCEQYQKAFFQYRSKYTSGQKCLISKLKPVINADGYIYPCCGVQYASDELRTMPKRYRMCHWSEFESTQAFDGMGCRKCYYSQYNDTLNLMTQPIEHKEFI